ADAVAGESTEKLFHRSAKCVRIQQLARKEAVKALERMYLPGELARALDGPFQPLPDPIAPQQCCDFEESRADGLARQCHTKGVDERSCFHTSVVGNPSDGELD